MKSSLRFDTSVLFARIVATILCLFLLCFARTFAGDNPKFITAVRVTTPPVMDGYPNEEIWQSAPPTGGLTQHDPEEGKPESQRTEIRVLYDDEALYFGIILHDKEPNKIVARTTRRDDEIESDRFTIYLDSYHDHQTCSEFTFNAAGVKVDRIVYDDANITDDSWDPVWDIQTHITPDGWCAEVKIPFTSLKYKRLDSDTTENIWGVNFIRYISRRQETDMWAFVPKNQSGYISRFGHIHGLRNLPNVRQLFLLPFMVAKEQYLPPDSTFKPNQTAFGNAGLDLKYGVSNNFTLDATVNPDFGQVEADPSVLNLSTYPTFYPEQRPFFIEGTQILHFSTFGSNSGPGMFYSRRIGRGISLDEVDVPANWDVTSYPQQATILGAAKLTGKTNSGLSVGVLEAVTNQEDATLDSAGLKSAQQMLAPTTNYSLVRLKQDILENSNIGMIVTSTANDPHHPSFTNGYDWQIKLDSNAYMLDGFFTLSHSLAYNTTDLAFEGPDVWGSAGKFDFSRIGAQHWLWDVEGDWTSKRYDIDDIGFFYSPDDHGATATLIYKEDVPGDILRNYSFTGFTHQRWNFEGADLFRDGQFGGSALLNNYWNVNFNLTGAFGLYDEFASRGFGLYAKPHRYEENVSISSDQRDEIVVALSEDYVKDAHGLDQFTPDIAANWRPISWMNWTAEWYHESQDHYEYWAENTDHASIFADLTTRQNSFTIRNTTTFTRDLTLQVYSQLFLAKAHYANLRQLATPSSFTTDFIDPDEIVDPDFDEQTFNLNVVLRWEYLPGSTAFLVWSEARNTTLANFYQTTGDEIGDAFGMSPANVILLKVNYLLSL